MQEPLRIRSRIRVVGGLLACLGSLPGGAQAPPQTADIAKIYNIEGQTTRKVEVWFSRKGQCPRGGWCPVTGSGEYLKTNDWLLTGNVSRADLALMYDRTRYRKVLFWQQEGSRSLFEPKPGTCFFRIDHGKFLYAHPHQSVDKGCEKITSDDALIFPNGTALFVVRNSEDQETLVGVLSHRPQSPVLVQHRGSGRKAENVQAGEYVKTLRNGAILRGEFDLADFYRNQVLGLGLGPGAQDEAYVNRQEPAIREILREIRRETLAALKDQKPRSSPPSVDPIRPAAPIRPAGPVRPANPTGPTGPAGPVGPAEPSGPIGPVGPVDVTGPVNPATPPTPIK